MKILDILDSLSATTKRNEKLEILKSHESNDTLKEVFRLTYSPLVQFNIKKIPEYSTVNNESYTLDSALFDIVDEFVNRKVRGHAAIDFLASALSMLDESDAKVLERVVTRDLRVGCSESSANKVWKGLVVEQPCMLASSYKEKLVDKILESDDGAFAELKADGARCMAIVDAENEVRFVSRNGKAYHGLTALSDRIKRMNITEFVVDGELVYAPNGIHEVEDRSTGNGIVNKSSKGKISDEEQSNIVFQVWDIIPLAVYEGTGNDLNAPYRLRKQVLADAVRATSTVDDNIQTVPFTRVYNKDEASREYRNYVEMGLEGIILKDPEALWEDKRSKSLVKYKEVHDADMYIVGYLEGTGKNKGRMGSLLLESACKQLTCKVGSGFSDKQRDEYWENQDERMGNVVEVNYNAITKAKGSDTYSLFLPIFVEERFDKSVANTLEEIYDRQE